MKRLSRLTVRRAEDRGRSDFGWLDSRHTFSFGRYQEANHTGFRSLLVLNEDRVEPGRGFGTHPHENMEILSYVVQGTIEHRDSMGNGSRVVPGELQRMTAGTGVAHSEFNPSAAEPLHFLQIWIRPECDGLYPGYEQKAFPLEEQRGHLVLVASRDGRGDSVTVHQDVLLYAGRFSAGQSVRHDLGPGRHGWIQGVRGTVSVNGEELHAGDGAATSAGQSLELRATSDAELLLFDLD
jgi:redox-sensitive bicupin YhaK (pirin superfamily)